MPFTKQRVIHHTRCYQFNSSGGLSRTPTEGPPPFFLTRVEPHYDDDDEDAPQAVQELRGALHDEEAAPKGEGQKAEEPQAEESQEEAPQEEESQEEEPPAEEPQEEGSQEEESREEESQEEESQEEESQAAPLRLHHQFRLLHSPVHQLPRRPARPPEVHPCPVHSKHRELHWCTPTADTEASGLPACMAQNCQARKPQPAASTTHPAEVQAIELLFQVPCKQATPSNACTGYIPDAKDSPRPNAWQQCP
jgi:hypothetical protein